MEQDDRLPFQGLPIVILFVADPSVEEKEVLRLREEGQSLADRYAALCFVSLLPQRISSFILIMYIFSFIVAFSAPS